MTFDQYQYGGSGADGIALFLVDGSASLTTTGAPGGSLGYAQDDSTPGVHGGYLGVGLDAYGNFANDGGGRGAGCTPPSPREGEQPNSVAVRGPGQGSTGYCWLADNTSLPGDLRSGDANGDNLAPARRSVRITVTPEATPTVSVDIDFHDGNGWQTVLSTQLAESLPATVKFGLAGSTGGSDDVHLIQSVAVASVVPLPAINLVKQVNQSQPQPAGYAAGDVVPYDLVVTNTTGAALTDVAVSDPLVSSVSCPSTSLAPAGQVGSTMVCGGSRTITTADAQQSTFTNTATAAGTDGGGNPLSSTSSVTVRIARTAAVSIVKATTKAVVTAAEEEIPYTFTITNLEKVRISEIAVSDPMVPTVECPITELGPGEHTVCTGTHSVTQAELEAGEVANIADVSATDAAGFLLNARSGAVVVPALYAPALSIVTTTTATTLNSVDEEIPYTFTVTNTGNVPIEYLYVGDFNWEQADCPVENLGPGEQTVCTRTHRVTQEDLDAGQVVYHGRAYGRAGGSWLNVLSNEHILSASPRPELAIVKSTSTSYYDRAGASIPYTFVVVNTGNQLLSNVVVDDPLLGGEVCTTPILQPGHRATCTAAYSVTADALDAGQVVNQATASGMGPQPVSAVSDEVVVPGIYRPGLTVVKSSGTTGFDRVGVEIPYRFRIINTGTVTLDNITVNDPRISGVQCPEATLPLGEQMTCDGLYEATQADLDAGQAVNTASADGDVPAGGPDMAPATSNEVIIPGQQRPGLSMVKSADVSEVTSAGQKVEYGFAVTNTGNTTLENVVVTDAKVPAVNCPTATLAPAASMSCTAVYTVTTEDMKAGRIINVASATGSVPGRPPLPAISSNQVEIRAVAGTPPAGDDTPDAPPDGATPPVGSLPAGDSTPVGSTPRPGGDEVGGDAVERNPAPSGDRGPTGAPAPATQLPRTGGDVSRLVLSALALGILGTVTRAAVRRRHPPA